MPEDDHTYRKTLAVGAAVQVRFGGRWQEATIVNKSERGKSETVLAKTADGTFVSVRDPSQWRPSRLPK
jgi:hypothetical protein